jgi:hypothetical protein
MRTAYKISVEKPEEKRLVRRPRRRWEDKSKMDIKEIGCENEIVWLTIRSGGGLV